MRSYEPEKHFDKQGTLIPELKELAPKGTRRMSANPVANGGILRRKLAMPDFRDYATDVRKGGAEWLGSMANFAKFLRDVIKNNPTHFRVFGPDETESNKLATIYEAGKKVWMGDYFDEDADGGNLAYEGRVMEMLSEHTVEVSISPMAARVRLLTLNRAGSRATFFPVDMVSSTATNPLFTSSIQWLISTASGSRNASKLNGVSRSPRLIFYSQRLFGDKTTTASHIKIQASLT